MLTITRLFGSAAPATATVVVVAASAFVSATVANNNDAWGGRRGQRWLLGSLGPLGLAWALLGSPGLAWAFLGQAVGS